MTGRLAVLAVAASLAACANPWQGYAPNRAEIVAGGWVAGQVAAAPPPIYCYATLAVTDCFALPKAGQGNRLVGHYGPPPR